MTTFTFKCNEPLVSFGDRFHVGGKADVFGWRHHEHRRVPDLRGFNIYWTVEFNRTAFAYYEESQLNKLETISSRTPNFRTYWQDAKGFMRRYDTDAVNIVFSAPPGLGFEAFFMGIVTAGMSVGVLTPSISFAEREDAPSPSCRAFLDGREPAFFGHYSDPSSNYPIFTPLKR